MATPYYQVSRTTAVALEEFSEEFKNALALGDVTPWAEQLGLVRQTDVLKTTFPLPVSAAGYSEFKDDIKYRSLYHRAMSMTSKQWQDGVEALARQVEAPDFSDWAGEPTRMALEALRLPNEMVAAVLAQSSFNGPLLDLYRDDDTQTASTIRLFASNHPYNVFDASVGTFDNTDTITLAQIADGTVVERAMDHFRSIKGPNGKPLGLRFGGGTFLVPSTRETIFKKLMEHDTLVRSIIDANDNERPYTQNNIYSNVAKYVVADELRSETYFYAFAAGKPGLYPWVVQKGRVEEIRHDKDSHKYKETLKIGMAEILEANANAAMPHGVLRFQITG